MGRSLERCFMPCGRNGPVDDVPIHSVTNGVHVPTWVAKEMDVLYQKYLGSDWRERCDDPTLWQRINEVPDAELWDTRQRLKRKMLVFHSAAGTDSMD